MVRLNFSKNLHLRRVAGFALLTVSSWSQPLTSPTPSIPVVLDSGNAPSATNAPPVTEEAIKLSAEGKFAVQQAEVGDTVEYTIHVEWKDLRIPVMVLPPESLETPGFRITGQRTTQRKIANATEILNDMQFLFKLVPKLPGNAKVGSFKLKYITGLSNHEETFLVPSAFLDIYPAHIPFYSRFWFQLLACLLFLSALFFGIWKWILTLKAGRYRALKAKNRDFTPEILSLKGRWNSADSKTWITDAEKISQAWLMHKLSSPSSSQDRFEDLLSKYLSTVKPPTPEVEGWDHLKELFHHARYAGGRKDPHELQDAYRTLKTCLHISGEIES